MNRFGDQITKEPTLHKRCPREMRMPSFKARSSLNHCLWGKKKLRLKFLRIWRQLCFMSFCHNCTGKKTVPKCFPNESKCIGKMWNVPAAQWKGCWSPEGLSAPRGGCLGESSRCYQALIFIVVCALFQTQYTHNLWNTLSALLICLKFWSTNPCFSFSVLNSKSKALILVTSQNNMYNMHWHLVFVLFM